MTRRLKQIMCLSVALLLLGGCVCGKTAYFRKIDEETDFTVIRGKYLVSESIAKDVDCYRFYHDPSGKLVKIEYLRSTMIPNSWLPSGATQARFQYSDDSEKRTFFNSKGKVILSHHLELKDNRPASISIYDHTGQLVERYELICNEKGLLSKMFFLNEKGERISNDFGIYEWRFEYDAKNNRRESRFYASDGQPKEMDESGIGIIQNDYDDYGNVIEQRYYGADGKPKEAKGMWAARYSVKYDEKGNEIERRHYGIDGNLKENSGKVAMWRYKYNDRGDRIEVRCYGANEQLKEGKSGWAIIRITYDYEKHRTENRFYGADETLKETTKGTAIMVFQYDSDGNLKELRHLGIDGQLKDNNDGFAITRYEFDQEGKRTKATYFDRTGRVVKEE